MTLPLPSFPVTAFSAISAAGRSADDVIAVSELGRTALSTGQAHWSSTGYCGTVQGIDEALSGAVGDLDARVARIARAGLRPIDEHVRRAVERWGPHRVAVVLGTSTGGIAETEHAFGELARSGRLPDAFDLDRQHAFSALVELLTRLTGARGVAFAVSTACASSNKVLGTAQRLLATGFADAVLAGGADSLCATTLRGFAGLRVLSASPCRPFDEARDGITIGEGAGFLLLERNSADALCYLLGVGESSDAHHMTAPHPEGLGAEQSMRGALSMAGIDGGGVDYVHAHGTGTPLNDQVESDAILRVVGPDVPVSSTKGIIGHLLGAAGALSTAACAAALLRGRLPVNVGLSRRDPKIGVRLVERPTEGHLRRVLANTFAFGGCNASVLLGTAPAHDPPRVPRTIALAGASFWTPGYPTLAHALSDERTDSLLPEARLLSPRARGRASPLTRMFAEVIGQLAAPGRLDLGSIPAIYGSAYGEMTTTLSLLEAIAGGDALLSPIRFQASVHNAAAGLLSIESQNRSFSTAVAAGPTTAAMALVEAVAWLQAHGGDVIVAVADEAAPAPLWRGPAYPPVAMALHLTAEPPPPGALERAILKDLRRAPLPERKPTLQRFEANPSAGALSLLDAFAGRRPGTVPLEARAGEGWVVDLLT
jgi:3-oxoacyl-[acyl-carrier-protein] synthase-1